MKTELTTENFKICLTNGKVYNEAQDMLVNKRYNELEELLRVELLSAQDRVVILNKMYAEISNKNLIRDLDDYDL